VHATDPTNASRTLLFDIDSRSWSDELCSVFNVPRSILPEVRSSSGDFGIAAADFVGTEIPIRGVAGDQQAALFGQGCFEAGQGKNTFGTGAFLLLTTGARRRSPGAGILVTVACDASGGYAYAPDGSIFIAGRRFSGCATGLA
jgi:glycerol kinase